MTTPTFLDVIARTRAVWPHFFARFLRTPGVAPLSAVELGLIVTLDAGDRDLAGLAQVLGRPNDELRRALDDLAGRGFVIAGPRYRLADSGKKMVETMLSSRAEMMDELLAILAPAERDDVLRAFGHIAKAVDCYTHAPA